MCSHDTSVHHPERRQTTGRHLLVEQAVEMVVHNYVDMPGGNWTRHHVELQPDLGNPLHVGTLPPLVQVG